MLLTLAIFVYMLYFKNIALNNESQAAQTQQQMTTHHTTGNYVKALRNIFSGQYNVM